VPNLGIHYRDTLRSLRKGECREFECGRCRRVGLVTLLQLVRLKYPPDTPFVDIERNSYCRRCGRGHWLNKVRVIYPRA
jgi:predicted RNA-binding protein with PUA-like domain